MSSEEKRPLALARKTNHFRVMPKDWSEEEFLARIDARLAELGKSRSGALTQAGASADLIRKEPAYGRRIDSIITIARACDWTLAEALGITGLPDPDLLRISTALALRMIPRRRMLLVRRGYEERIAEAVTTVYDYFARAAEEGTKVPDLRAGESIIKSLMRGWQAENSQ